MTPEEANLIREMFKVVEQRVERLEFQHQLLVGQVDNLAALIKRQKYGPRVIGDDGQV